MDIVWVIVSCIIYLGLFLIFEAWRKHKGKKK